MKHFTLLLVWLLGNALSASPLTQAQVEELKLNLEKSGLDTFVSSLKQNHTPTPDIHSSWHLANVSSFEEKSLDQASRTLGNVIARQMDEMALRIRSAPADRRLLSLVDQLIALAEWCSASEHYGNAFLTQRAVDIVAVGIARLTGNLDFPIEEIDELVKRLPASWDAGLRQRILNHDAGVVIFTTNRQKDIEETWASGKLLRAEAADPLDEHYA